MGSVSYIDRCSDFMHRAYPDEGITITATHMTTDAQSNTVTVTGTRSGVPETSTFARDVAVECRFETGILTGFHWTAGPLRPKAPAPGP